MRRCFLLLMLPVCGCINYVLPTFEMTPALKVGEERQHDIHVFRVDVLKKTGLINEEEYSFSRIPYNGGRVSSQVQAGVDKGVVGLLLFYREHYHDGVLVRLYRPGFKTVSVRAGDSLKSIDWQPADSLEDREHAIDELIASSAGSVEKGDDGVSDWSPPQGLRRGTHSKEQAEFLRFAAGQYSELARIKHDDCSTRDHERLADKEKMLIKHVRAAQ